MKAVLRDLLIGLAVGVVVVGLIQMTPKLWWDAVLLGVIIGIPLHVGRRLSARRPSA